MACSVFNVTIRKHPIFLAFQNAYPKSVKALKVSLSTLKFQSTHSKNGFHKNLSNPVTVYLDNLFQTDHLSDLTLKDSEICNIFHRFGRTCYRRTVYATSATGNQRFPMLRGRPFDNRAPKTLHTQNRFFLLTKFCNFVIVFRNGSLRTDTSIIKVRFARRKQL